MPRRSSLLPFSCTAVFFSLITLHGIDVAAQACVDYDEYLNWVGTVDTPGSAISMVIAGSNLYLADYGSGVSIYDITDPAFPALVGSLATPGSAFGVDITGTILCVADTGGGLRFADVSDPADPVLVGSLALENVIKVLAAGATVFASTSDGDLFSIDIGDPSAPAILATVSGLQGKGMAYADGYLYVAAHDDSAWAHDVAVLDVSDPSSPVLVGWGALYNFGEAKDVALDGSLLYVAHSYGLFSVFDVTTPSAPVRLGTLTDHGDAFFVTAGEGVVLIDDPLGGYDTIDASDPGAPAVLGELGIGSGEPAIANGYAYLPDGEQGILVATVANPVNPSPIQVIARSGTFYSWPNDVAVEGDFVCVANDAWGFRIVDSNPVTSAHTVKDLDLGSYAYGVAIGGQYAYVATYDGLSVVDISVPTSASVTGTVSSPGDARGVAVSGTHAFLAAQSAGLLSVDVSDPGNPVIAATLSLPANARKVEIVGDHAFVADRAYGLVSVDISSPLTPTITDVLDTPGSVEQLHIADGLAYVADRQGGLLIVDVSDPADLSVVGSFPIGDVLAAAADGNVAYVGLSNWTLLLDVTDPATPEPIGVLPYPALDFDFSNGVPIIAAASEMLVFAPPPCLSGATTVEAPGEVASSPAVSLAHPNPFVTATSIALDLPGTGLLDVGVFDVRGRKVRRMSRTIASAGRTTITWDGSGDDGRRQPAGVYLLRARTAGRVFQEKLILSR